MCRIAAYVGPPLPLAALLYDAPRALTEQAVAPREQQQGRINVDGTGVAWWEAGDRAPLSYRTVQAPWADANLPGLARRLHGDVALAAVRSASPGMPVSVTATHPFVVDGLAGTHNGRIEGFRAHVAAPLLARLGPEWTGRLEIVTDASVLVMLAAAEVAAGASPAAAARSAVGAAARAAAAAGQWATLTLVLATGDGVVAVNGAHGRQANSLYVADRGAASWLASEPLDDGGDWEPVPPGATAVLARDAPVALTAAATDPEEAVNA